MSCDLKKIIQESNYSSLNINNYSIIGCNLNDVNITLNNIYNDNTLKHLNKLCNNFEINNQYINNKDNKQIDNAYNEGLNIFKELCEFKKINKYYIADEYKKNELSEIFYNNIKNKYSFFFTTFPLIIKFMFNLMLFDTIGFRKFLIYYFNTEISNNMSDNIKLNCKYIYFVYLQILLINNNKSGNKKCKKNIIINKALQFEEYIYNITIKEYNNIITTLKQNNIKQNKKTRLIEFIQNNYIT